MRISLLAAAAALVCTWESASAWPAQAPIDFDNQMELIASRGCGSRGGPGFRGPNGKCVGWANLAKVCGTPPTTRCTNEGGAAEDGTSIPGAAFLAGAGATAVGGPKAFNVRVIKRDSLGCTSQTMLVGLAACDMSKKAAECKSRSDEAIAAGECAPLQAGTEAAIQAGSHSFEWVRIRVKGELQELWVERRLVMD